MNIINFIGFTYYYLKGVLRFKSKNYSAAQKYFKKAAKCNKDRDNVLFFQYYGQTLLSLDKINESFELLSKAYDIYNKEGWKVLNDDEHRLAKNTLDALKYLDDKCNLKVDGFTHKMEIQVK